MLVVIKEDVASKLLESKIQNSIFSVNFTTRDSSSPEKFSSVWEHQRLWLWFLQIRILIINMDENNQTLPVNATNTSIVDGQNEVPTVIWFWSILGTIGIVAFFGNTLVIYLIATRRRLQTTCNSFILSLSFSDLLTAVVTIPGSFVCEFGVPCSRFFYTLYSFLICASVGNVCTMTADRFCRVVYPLRYPVLMSPKRVVVTIAIGWTLPIFLQLIPELYIFLSPTIDHENDARNIFNAIQMFTFAIFPCIGLLLVYAKISRITLKHSRRQRVQVEQISRNSRVSQQMAKQVTRKSFSVLVLGVVIFLFVLCWSFSIYRGICDSFSLCKVKPPLVFVSRAFLVANTAADPVVYAILKQDIRRELVRTFSRTRNRVRGQDLFLTETRIGGQSYM